MLCIRGAANSSSVALENSKFEQVFKKIAYHIPYVSLSICLSNSVSALYSDHFLQSAGIYQKYLINQMLAKSLNAFKLSPRSSRQKELDISKLCSVTFCTFTFTFLEDNLLDRRILTFPNFLFQSIHKFSGVVKSPCPSFFPKCSKTC